VLTQLRKIAMAGGILLALGLAPILPANAEEAAPADSAGASVPYAKYANGAFDILVLRPLDAAALVSGAGLMIPASVFGLMGGMEVVDDSWDILVLTSWESLVDRPLGDFGS
jgi:hypothetical protein